MVGFAALWCQHTQYVVALWLGLSLLSSVSKHNMWSHYGSVCLRCRPSVSSICGRNKVGFDVVVVNQ
jgi:hypothetical protein